MGLNEIQKKERSAYLESNLEITECSQRRHYAFISYASDNWETVFKSAVVPMQKQYGLRVYADKAFDKVNDKWIVPMLRNVRGADVIVTFISQSYIESYACFLELLTAVNSRKQIIFVSLEEQLRLGDTTDLPMIEQGAKNEILNQGANIATNTNHTSNDIMRAMKSAYTSLSTLLQQDALSKYDISDAFINFLKDASVNRKTINDLGALRWTIKSVSRDVFDKALAAERVQKPEPAQIAEPEQPTAPEPKEDFSFSDSKLSPQKLLTGRRIGGIAAAAAVVVAPMVAPVVVPVAVAAAILGGTKKVTDIAYTTPDGFSGTYTGEWKKDQPEGQGTFTTGDGVTYTGEWKDGKRNGKGILTYSDGSVLVGEWEADEKNGDFVYTEADGNVVNEKWDHGTKVDCPTQVQKTGEIEV